MDGTNHSSQTLQSLSPDKREGLDHDGRYDRDGVRGENKGRRLADAPLHASEAQPKNVLNNQVKATLAWSLSDDSLRTLRRLRILIVHGAKDLVVRPSSARQFHRVLEGRADGSCCFRGAAAAVAPESRAKLLMLEDAAHMTIFSHPTRIAEAVDELWGGALRYEEEL